VLAKMRTENLKAVSAKQESIDDFEQYADEYFKTTVFSGLCRSWYKNGTYDGYVTSARRARVRFTLAQKTDTLAFSRVRTQARYRTLARLVSPCLRDLVESTMGRL
jgi:hypothetical protein